MKLRHQLYHQRTTTYGREHRASDDGNLLLRGRLPQSAPGALRLAAFAALCAAVHRGGSHYYRAPARPAGGRLAEEGSPDGGEELARRVPAPALLHPMGQPPAPAHPASRGAAGGDLRPRRGAGSPLPAGLQADPALPRPAPRAGAAAQRGWRALREDFEGLVLRLQAPRP